MLTPFREQYRCGHTLRRVTTTNSGFSHVPELYRYPDKKLQERDEARNTITTAITDIDLDFPSCFFRAMDVSFNEPWKWEDLQERLEENAVRKEVVYDSRFEYRLYHYYLSVIGFIQNPLSMEPRRDRKSLTHFYYEGDKYDTSWIYHYHFPSAKPVPAFPISVLNRSEINVEDFFPGEQVYFHKQSQYVASIIRKHVFTFDHDVQVRGIVAVPAARWESTLTRFPPNAKWSHSVYLIQPGNMPSIGKCDFSIEYYNTNHGHGKKKLYASCFGKPYREMRSHGNEPSIARAISFQLEAKQVNIQLHRCCKDYDFWLVLEGTQPGPAVPVLPLLQREEAMVVHYQLKFPCRAGKKLHSDPYYDVFSPNKGRKGTMKQKRWIRQEMQEEREEY